MKRILVPVDFSIAAENALQYALNFGKPFNAEIICLHAINEGSAETNARVKLETFIAKNNLAAASNLTVKNVVVDGVLDKAVNEFSRIAKIDLIVMGTKGAAGFQKVLGGSNTTDILSSTSLPVLIVPQGLVFKSVNWILMASDFHAPTHLNSLNTLVEIARTFNAELRIGHVKTSDKQGSTQKQLEVSHLHQFLSEKGVKYSLKKIRSADISEGIKYYLELKGDNDMLVMVRRKHGFLSRMFRQDHTYEFACNPTLPLLIVQE